MLDCLYRVTDETYSLRKEKVLDAHASRKGCEKIFPYNKSTFKYIYNHLKSPLFSINYQFATDYLTLQLRCLTPNKKKMATDFSGTYFQGGEDKDLMM